MLRRPDVKYRLGYEVAGKDRVGVARLRLPPLERVSEYVVGGVA